MNEPARTPSRPPRRPFYAPNTDPSVNPSPVKASQIEAAPWAFVRDFTDAETGICIRMNARTLPPRFAGAVPLTEFSWELLRMNKSRVSRFFSILFTRRVTMIAIDSPFNSKRLAELIGEAEAWALNERQAREDKIVEQRSRKEERLAGRGGNGGSGRGEGGGQ